MSLIRRLTTSVLSWNGSQIICCDSGAFAAHPLKTQQWLYAQVLSIAGFSHDIPQLHHSDNKAGGSTLQLFFTLFYHQSLHSDYFKHCFIVRAGQILRSAYKTAKGCTGVYCPLLILYVSGDRCPAITTKPSVGEL